MCLYLSWQIHQNGLVKVYESFEPEDSNTQPWRKRAHFTLGTSTRNANIHSALLSSLSANRLVWVEETKEATLSGDLLHYRLFMAELEQSMMVGFMSKSFLIFNPILTGLFESKFLLGGGGVNLTPP